MEHDALDPEVLNLADFFLGARLREGRGERVALRTDEGTWSYAQVYALAGRFGHRLKDAGVHPEERVIVAVPDSPACVGALFGALGIGAVLVMVNPHQQREALAEVLRYTRATACVVDKEHRDLFAQAAEQAGWSGALLVADEATLDEGPSPFEIFPSHPDDPAIWLFSGGTTGRPKAVVQSHASFVNTTRCTAHGLLRYQEDDLTLSVPKLWFGYALGSNLFFPFSVGAAAVLFPERCTPERISDLARRHRPTLLINVPSFIGRMVEHPDVTGEALSSLRLATSAGEALSATLHERWRQRFGVELCDGLGTAEMWHVFLSNRPGASRPGSLGQVVDGFEIKLCDPDGAAVPDGEVGRMWVRGDSLAHGYWQRPAATREAFRGAWYVSGDMLSRDADGFYTWCGRADDLFKVSGRWFSPAELEEQLACHPGVAGAAVVAVIDDSGLSLPVAFIAAEDSPALREDLARHLAERLPGYKHPRAVYALEQLPRTHLGKVDRGALKRRAQAALER